MAMEEKVNLVEWLDMFEGLEKEGIS